MSLLTLRKVGGIALAILLLAGGRLTFAQSSDSAEIMQLLANAETSARAATEDAATLETYTRGRTSWQIHGQQLEIMKEHVNQLITEVNKLSSLREQASPWQQEAIDRIDPLLQSMAEHLTATIKHLNDYPARVHMGPYRDYARGNTELADKTYKVIHDFVEYGQSRAKAEKLEKQLDLQAEGQ